MQGELDGRRVGCHGFAGGERFRVGDTLVGFDVGVVGGVGGVVDGEFGNVVAWGFGADGEEGGPDCMGLAGRGPQEGRG